ncbi:tryptophan 2,3-dioxygenase family protein [Rheinheimera sp. WS51]|uniref:tryptophan 2,3-dioxygenase family protein n=1 Tax=Rheinheimera sp. WS51 TaxID=3425886 RepID=UPI003D8F2A75
MKELTAVKKKDYSPVLTGKGNDDYARYMGTDTLLSLQRTAEERLHRDEMLFQVVHQSTELWLKLGCHELADVIEFIEGRVYADATALLRRASFGIELIMNQLEMLKFMTPWDFQGVRPALGNGSGFESPGWRNIQKNGELINQAFENLIAERKIDLILLYKDQRNSPLFELCEALIDWDEKVSLWRTRHYKIAVRTIGLNTIGTKGTPIEKLTRLLNTHYFPTLWDLRTQLTKDDAAY